MSHGFLVGPCRGVLVNPRILAFRVTLVDDSLIPACSAGNAMGRG